MKKIFFKVLAVVLNKIVYKLSELNLIIALWVKKCLKKSEGV
jgi:hypothetical protein